MSTSWNKATTAPKPYCHFLKRIKMNINMTRQDSNTAQMAFDFISRETVSPTFCELITVYFYFKPFCFAKCKHKCFAHIFSWRFIIKTYYIGTASFKINTQAKPAFL